MTAIITTTTNSNNKESHDTCFFLKTALEAPNQSSEENHSMFSYSLPTQTCISAYKLLPQESVPEASFCLILYIYIFFHIPALTCIQHWRHWAPLHNWESLLPTGEQAPNGRACPESLYNAPPAKYYLELEGEQKMPPPNVPLSHMAYQSKPNRLKGKTFILP